MKKQIMLKMILCFFIIMIGINVDANASDTLTLCSTCKATNGSENTFVEADRCTNENVEVIKVKSGGSYGYNYYHEIICSTCEEPGYVTRSMESGDRYRCLGANSNAVTGDGVYTAGNNAEDLRKIESGYYHLSEKKCGTHNCALVEVLDSTGCGYKCTEDFNRDLYEFVREYYHPAQGQEKCSTYGCDGSLVEFANGELKCSIGTEWVACIQNRGGVFHKVEKCNTCQDQWVFRNEANNLVCNSGMSRVMVDSSTYQHTSSSIRCATCNNDNTITLNEGSSDRGTCSLGSDAIIWNGQWRHIIGGCSLPGHGEVVQASTDSGAICITSSYNANTYVYLDKGEYVHADSVSECQTCFNSIIDDKCTNYPDGTLLYSDPGNAPGRRHYKGKCNDEGDVVELMDGKYFCHTHQKIVNLVEGVYICSESQQPPVTEPPTVVEISGGPSASAFFNAGNPQAGWDVIDDEKNIAPILHIQSLIMMVGVYAAVVVVLIYGIQWTMATPAKRKELKDGLIPLILGVILLIAGPKLAIMIVSVIL